MRKLMYSLLLGAMTIGGIAIAPTPAQAQTDDVVPVAWRGRRWVTGNYYYPAYRSYYYSPGYTSFYYPGYTSYYYPGYTSFYNPGYYNYYWTSPYGYTRYWGTPYQSYYWTWRY